MEIGLEKRNEKELQVKFSYHVGWWNRMLRFPQSRWVPSEKIWIIPDVDIQIAPDLHQECYLLSNPLSKPTVKEYKLELEKTSWGSYVESKLMFELKLRGYSLKTIKAYCGHVERFYRYYELHREIPTLDLISSFSHQLLENQLSHSYVNQAISAIKFYLEKVCGMLEANFPYVRPKKEHKLPNVLAPSEVIRLLSVLKNLKHRALFYLIYSSGLRVGEAVRLRLVDIDHERKTIHIRQGKGRKDRLTVISDAALEVITQYQLDYKLSSWLFPGQQPERHLTERTVQKVFEQAVTASHIAKEVSVHSLRHSFARHLLEDGIDIRYIQELLGHKSILTTEIYTHVAVKDVRRIVSPLDRIMNKGN